MNIIEDIGRVIKAAEQESWGNAERKALKKVCDALGPPTIVAQALGISSATFFRWTKKETSDEHRPPPPKDRLLRLKNAVSSGEFELKLKGSRQDESKVAAFDAMMRAMTPQEVMGHSDRAVRTWMMRTGRPFVIASDSKMLEFIIKFMEEAPQVTAYFVYRDVKQSQEIESIYLQAKVSYEAFHRQLETKQVGQAFLDRVRAVPVLEESDIQVLSLGDYWTSYCMMEYGPEGFDKYGTTVNVWQEFLVDTAKPLQFESIRPIWLQLPTREAMMWRDRRWPALKKLAGISASADNVSGGVEI